VSPARIGLLGARILLKSVASGTGFGAGGALELVNFIGIQLLNALRLSALLFMLAVGLSVVFGLLDVLNLAHCTLYMIGAYIG
jgi:ABC-type branched-subunit amino acid transport system permease subunit